MRQFIWIKEKYLSEALQLFKLIISDILMLKICEASKLLGLCLEDEIKIY